MKHRVITFSLAAALLAGALAAPIANRASAAVPVAPVASAPHAHPAFLDKTRFLLHMGLAYGAFHHWVYKPYKAHAFDSGAKGRTTAIVKAAAALLFTYHELRKAYDVAKASNSDLLHALIKPLDALSSTANKVWTGLKGGKVDTGALNGLTSAVNDFGKLSAGKGYSITDAPVSAIHF